MPALLALCSLAAVAAEPAAALAPAAVPTTAAPAASAALAAASRVTVIEDREVRIEETRIRGQLQRITVQSKLPGVKPYEIIVAPGGRSSARENGAEGQSVWSMFSF